MTSFANDVTYHPVFPVPIFRLHVKVEAGEVEYWEQQAQENKEQDARSVSNGWQSPRYRESTPTTRALQSIGFQTNAWWVNVLPPGGSNTLHSHPGVEFAAVRYLTTAHGLVLTNPHNHLYEHLFSFWNDERTHSKREVELQGQAGDVYIFPANIYHRVKPTNQPRISIAYNLRCQTQQEHL